MRDINLTGGQESMQKIIVETTPAVVERLSVIRSSPFEFDVTAMAIESSVVVGRATITRGESAERTTQRVESWSTMLTATSASFRA